MDLSVTDDLAIALIVVVGSAATAGVRGTSGHADLPLPTLVQPPAGVGLLLRSAAPR